MGHVNAKKTAHTADVVVASKTDAPVKGFDVESYNKAGSTFYLDIEEYYDVVILYDDDSVERIPLEEFILKD